MLSVLDVRAEEKAKTLRGAWKKLTRPSVEAYIQSAGGINYLRIYCREKKSGIDWRMVGAYALDRSERLLMPLGLEPPGSSGLRRYIPYEFGRRLLENLALDILVSCPKRPELRRVAVYGQESEVCALLPRLTSLAGEVRVITRRPYAVADTVEELRSKTGAAITVERDFSAEGFDMLLAPSGGAKVFELTENTVVLAPDRPMAAAALWIKSARPPMPPELESEYDGRYDVCEFVGAFYECGGIRRLGRLSPRAGITESGEVTAEDAAELIR